MSHNIRVRIDVSVSSAVGVCECGTRWISEDRAGARHEARRHEIACHPGSHSQLDRLGDAARRAGG